MTIAERVAKRDSAGAKLRVDSYVRVSSVSGRGGESFISPDEQRERIEHWAKSKGWEIAEVFQELDVSGRQMDRPKLNEVLRRIEAGESDGVVFYNVSRFARNVVEGYRLIERIDAMGGEAASVQESFDLSTPIGRFQLTLWLSLAKLHSDTIGETWLASMQRAANRGVYQANTRAFGYRWREDGTLDVDPVEGPLVTEIFQRRVAGQSHKEICDWLNGLGVRPPGRYRRVRADDGTYVKGPDGKVLRQEDPVVRPWGGDNLLNLLGKRVYLGQVGHHNRKGIQVNERAHPPLTDPVTWDLAQQTRSPRWASDKEKGHLLRGLVRCGGCRYTMNAKPATTAGYDESYKCNYRGCPEPTVIAARTKPSSKKASVFGLDEYVWEEVRAALEKLEAESFDARHELEELQAAARAAHAALEADATDLDLRDTLGEDAFRARIAKRREVADMHDRELDDAKRSARGALDQPADQIIADWPNMTVDEQRAVLASVVQCVFVRKGSKPLPPTIQASGHLAGRAVPRHAVLTGGHGASAARVRIVWRDEDPVDVPRQGWKGYVVRPFTDFADFPDVDEPSGVREAVA